MSLGSEKDNVSKNLPGRTRWICWRSFSKTMTMTRVTMLTMLTMMTMAIKMTMTMMVRESTWTNLFNLLEEHLQGWLDDLKVPSELSHHILQGILKDHVLKVKVLSAPLVQVVICVSIGFIHLRSVKEFETNFLAVN